jgi:hypothetical protein
MFPQYQFDFDSREVFAEKYYQNMGENADPFYGRDEYLEHSNANSLTKFENTLKE